MTIGSHQLPEAIQWHEGMLLAPQHFQQMSQRHEGLLHYHLLAAAPYHWGVRRLRIDPALLLDGTLRVTELEAVMPDGLLVRHLAGDAEPLEVSLRSFGADLKAAPVTVHLAVPAQRGTTHSRGELARFVSIEGAPVVDANTGDGELAIPRLRPRLALLPTDAPSDKYITVPLARVASRDEAFVLTDFLPPCLEVTPGSELGAACAQLAKRMREKAVFLAEKVRASAATARRPLVLETQMMVQGLVGALPPLEAVVRSGVAHPFTVYLALAGAVGHVAALGTGLVPPVLESYRHDDLRATFAPLIQYLGETLDGIHESHRAVPFHYENGGFHLAVGQDWLQQALIVGVVAAQGGSERDAVAWFEEAIIGSRGRVPSIRDRRIRGGARRRIDAVAEAGLVPRRNEVLFSLKPDPDYIEADDVLQVLHPGERSGQVRPAEIVYYAKIEV